MKTLKRTFLLVAVAAMLMPLLDSCKKGKEDPGISFRSRNARVTGTWTLKSYDMSGVNDTTITSTNDVNDDDYSYTSRTTWSETYNGSSVITNSVTDRDYTDQYMWYDIGNTRWEDQEVVYEYNSSDEDNTTWNFTISLYTDNTFETKETSGNANGKWKWDFDIEWDDSNDPGAADNDNDFDNDWSTTGTSTSIAQGAWYWEDNTKKNKLFLNAGPIKGQVIRLSNKEMIVEVQYGALTSLDQNFTGYEGEGTSDVGTDTYVMEDWPLNKYNDNDPLDFKDGDITTETSWTNSETIGRWVFEKTDKNSKRHKAGDSE